ncbi:hypothetical protein JCM8097_002205 [Rhodosporidiobolus ruineniae]
MAEALQQPRSPVVQRALALQPFKAAITRRDLATALRAFTAAWTALDQVQVHSRSARRLGERAAAVLVEVYEVIKRVDEVERTAMGDKVVLERSYEFRKEGSEDGAGQAGQGGVTKTKIQTAMLDLQMFATDYLALSTTSRLFLLVDGLPEQQRKLRTLTSSLRACLSAYTLSSPSPSSWADEDVDDLAADQAALPRLFQLSLALRGRVYDAFLASQPAGVAQDPPAKRRTAFVEWCYGRNPLLRPKEGSPSPSAIRRGKPKVSWPPAQEDKAVPSGLTAPASSTPRRVVSQPLPTSASFSPSPPPPATPPQLASPVLAPAAEEALSASPSPLSVSEPALEVAERDESAVEPARAVVSEEQDEPPSGSSVDQQDVRDGSVVSDSAVAPAAPSASSFSAADAAQLDDNPSSPAPLNPNPAGSSIARPPSPVGSAPVEVNHPLPDCSTSPPKPSSPPSSPSLSLPPADDPDPLLSLGRRDSSASSVAMTVTVSAGSRLFEPEGAVEEEGEGEEEVMADQAQLEEEPVVNIEGAPKTTTAEPMLEDGTVEDKTVDDESVKATPSGEDRLFAAGVEVEGEKDAPAETPSSPVFALTVEPAAEEDVKPVEPAATGSETSAAEKSHADGETAAAPGSILAELDAPEEAPRPTPAPAKPAVATPTPAKGLPSLSIPPSAPFRILSLDGGGPVGSIPQLLLLQQHLASHPSSSSPAQHFDLIVGTSSSALLAVLFGHFGLEIDVALKLYTRIAQKAFNLELPNSPAPQKAAKKGIWSRLFGLGGSSSPAPPAPQSSGPSETTRRENALDEALKAFLPQVNEPFSRSSSTKSKSRVAVLAYERISGATQEVWLSTDDAASHGLTVSEVIKASLAASSFFPPSSRFTRSPTSLNPSTAALSLVRSSSLALAGRPVSLLSLSTGYSSLSPDLLSSKRLSKSRLSALREVKQLAASNAVAAAALAAKVKREEGVEVRRVEVDCSGCGIEAREEWQSVEAIKSVIQARSGSGRSTPRPAASPSLTSSPALLSLTPATDSSSKPSLKKRASRLSFFGSLGSSSKSPPPPPPPSRRATSFLPSSSSSINLSPPVSPTPTTPSPSSPSLLAPPEPEPRRLRTSVSLGDMGRQEFATAVSGNADGRGATGMYGVKEAVGSVGSLGERRA